MDCTAIVPTIIDYTVVPVGRQVGYLIHYKSNLQNLRSQLKSLDAAKDRMKRTVNEVERRGKGVHVDVQNWWKEAEEITREAEFFLEAVRQAKCLHGICPNPVSYHQLSRKATKLVTRIEDHVKREFTSVSYDAPVKDICAIPSEGYMAFESRTSMVNDIMKELRNPDTTMIGVYGWGGVGKTTLAKEVFRQAREENFFDEVVIILNVKEKQNLEKIQKEIAEKLGMDSDESQSMAVRANRLWDRIKDKNILVILDDVLERIDLDDLGLLRVPSCNLLLTSRDENVLSSEMRTQKIFQLGLLNQGETWSLFEKIVGYVKDDRIRTVATQVARKCGGLPVLIIAVASALKDKSLAEWKDASGRFKSFDKKRLAYLALEWSYNQLDVEELKPLFLLCGIVAGRSCAVFLSDLLKYTMGLGLFKNANTVEESRDALLSLAKKLKVSGLLLDISEDEYVRMHELVRDVAIEIASNDQRAFSTANEVEFKEWPNEDFLKKCSEISLKYCKMPKLPEVPWVCPKLRLLILENGNIDASLEIPSNYFEGMSGLNVLDVTGLHIPSLPPSLQSLTNLQTLCLDQCVLGDIALVGHLTNLKILSLIHSQIKELPKEVGQLTRLQLLDLSNCSKLVLIPPDVISSLTRLEDLRMGINSFKHWEGESAIGERSNSSVSELNNLSHLTALELHIPDGNLLPANLFSNNLERYTIFVGDCWLYPDIYGTSSNMLKLKLATRNQFDQGIKLLLNRCENLSLDGMDVVNIIFYLLNSDGAKQLKHLHVQNNDEVTFIINSISCSYSQNAFPILESLSLDNLGSLESVCYGKLRAEPFQKLQSLKLSNLPKLIDFSSRGSRPVVTSRTHKQLAVDTKAEEIILENEIGGPTKVFMNGEVLMPNLTRLILHQCDGLRFLFSHSMASSLVQLEHLKISKCQNMEEIVAHNDNREENTDNMFCKLKHLKLQYLPSLARFCSGSGIDFPSLELLRIQDCTKLGTFISDAKSENITVVKGNEQRDSTENLETAGQDFLFDEKVGFPSLETLIIHDLPKLMTIWHNLAPGSFHKLKKVDVQRCHSLINVFVSSMVGGLYALDTLFIEQCQSLEVVYDTSSSTTQLNGFECPNLGFVSIQSCGSLKNIFPASVAKGLQQLGWLYVENCEILEEIIAKGEGSESTPEFVFSKVTNACFKKLPQLRSFYPGLYISRWPLLKNLLFEECGNLEIFVSEFSRYQEKLELGHCTPVKQPFLLIDKGNSFPNLEILGLYDGTAIWYEAYGPLSAECFTSLRKVRISGVDPNSFAFLEKLRNLEELTVYNGHGKEIFVYKGNSSGELHAVGRTLPQVKKLNFSKMEELLHLGIDNSQPAGPVFPNLELLRVLYCGRLVNLTSSAIPFQNLTTLQVWSCNGLKYLTTYSVATRLQQLKELEVESCERIVEIVASNGDENLENEIAFSRLQHLKLSNLPSLQGFCSSGNCIVKVPSLSLDTLVIVDCLIELKISPDGLLLSDSKPKKLQITEVEEEKEEVEEDDKAEVTLGVDPSTGEANMGEDAVRTSVEETHAESSQGGTSEAQNVAENVNEHTAGARGNGEPQVSDQQPTDLDGANTEDTPSNQASNQGTAEVATLDPNEVIALPPSSESQQASDQIHDQALSDTRAAANTEVRDYFSELSSSSQEGGNAESHQVAEDKSPTAFMEFIENLLVTASTSQLKHHLSVLKPRTTQTASTTPQSSPYIEKAKKVMREWLDRDADTASAQANLDDVARAISLLSSSHVITLTEGDYVLDLVRQQSITESALESKKTHMLAAENALQHSGTFRDTCIETIGYIEAKTAELEALDAEIEELRNQLHLKDSARAKLAKRLGDQAKKLSILYAQLSTTEVEAQESNRQAIISEGKSLAGRLSLGHHTLRAAIQALLK